MTYTMPLRLTILHLEQRFLIEADTFMITSPSHKSSDRALFSGGAKIGLYLVHQFSSSFSQYTLYQSPRTFLESHGTVSIIGPFWVIATLCSK